MSNNNKSITITEKDFLLYTAPDGEVKVNVLLQNKTIWLNAHQMAEHFGIDRSGIVKHLKNIYETGELELSLTCAKIAQVAKDRKKRVISRFLTNH